MAPRAAVLTSLHDLVRELRDLLAELVRVTRQASASGRALGPENYLSPREIAEETGHGLDRVVEVLARHRATLPHARRRHGQGYMERYRWREAQAVVLRELGGCAEEPAERRTQLQAAGGGRLQRSDV